MHSGPGRQLLFFFHVGLDVSRGCCVWPIVSGVGCSSACIRSLGSLGFLLRLISPGPELGQDKENQLNIQNQTPAETSKAVLPETSKAILPETHEALGGLDWGFRV